MPIICSILEIDGITGGEAAMHSLLILGILNDANIIFLDERVMKILINILSTDTSSELSEMCLELLHGQAEDGTFLYTFNLVIYHNNVKCCLVLIHIDILENAKLILAKAGVCELLLKLLEKHSPYCTDEETRSVLKIACNLIVLILTGGMLTKREVIGTLTVLYKYIMCNVIF